MVRPTLIDQLSNHNRALAANMLIRGEPFDLILEYINMDESFAIRKGIQQLADELEYVMPDPIYFLHVELAKTDVLIRVAVEKAKEGSPRHMSEFTKMSGHRTKLLSELYELEEQEAAKGNTWEPIYDVESPEFKVFEAAAMLFLTKDEEDTNDFGTLSAEDQARFFKILAESGG